MDVGIGALHDHRHDPRDQVSGRQVEQGEATGEGAEVDHHLEEGRNGEFPTIKEIHNMIKLIEILQDLQAFLGKASFSLLLYVSLFLISLNSYPSIDLPYS